MSLIGLIVVGLKFASWLEFMAALLLCTPFLFFLVCIVYLLWLLINAIPSRSRIMALSIPDNDSTNKDTIISDLQGSSSPQMNALPLSSIASPIVSPIAVPSTTPTSLPDLPRFVLLIPAHNEELLLGAALEKLRHIAYPADRYRVVVIADNCNDTTAQIARDAGALALERFDKERIGKGYALEDTLAWLMSEQSMLRYASRPDAAQPDDSQSTDKAENEIVDSYIHGSTTLRPGILPEQLMGWEEARAFDAVVVLDADTFVSTNLLSIFAAALGRGERAIQARYDVLNTNESWRTRLMSCALALAHVVKPLGRERLRLSDGLKGNGMCFARTVVEEVPWSGESVTEDIEYALRLCRAGHRIAFVPEACVWAQMPTTGTQAASQRQRWEGGRYRLLFQVAPKLVAESLRTRNRLLMDRAIELIVPPFAEMFALPVLLGTICAVTGMVFGWHVMSVLALAWFSLLLLQAIYLLMGMWIARMPFSVIVSLAFAPFYIVWKLSIYLVMAAGRSAGGWKRTERHELSK